MTPEYREHLIALLSHMRSTAAYALLHTDCGRWTLDARNIEDIGSLLDRLESITEKLQEATLPLKRQDTPSS